MNKAEAIKKVALKRKEQAEEKFTSEVETIIYEISRLGSELRDKKKQLTDLSYEEPKDIEDLK